MHKKPVAKIETLMTDDEVSNVMQVPTATLAHWRSSNRVRGLKFVRLGKAVRYRRADVEKFIAANVQGSQ